MQGLNIYNYANKYNDGTNIDSSENVVITVSNPRGVEKDVIRILINGNPVVGKTIPFESVMQTNVVELLMG